MTLTGILNKKLLHIPTGQNGEFVKEYQPTGKSQTTQIKLNDGRIYFAPSNEFIECGNAGVIYPVFPFPDGNNLLSLNLKRERPNEVKQTPTI